MADPYVGKLTYFRVYSGKLAAGGRVLNATTGKTERIGRLLMMHANHREEIEEATRATSSPASASSRPPPATRSAPPTRPCCWRRSSSPSR